MPARRSLRQLAWAGLLVLLGSCGDEVVDYDALYLRIRSEAPAAGTITHLDIALHNVAGGPALKLPATPNDPDYSLALPAGKDLVTSAYTVRVVQPAGSAGQLQLRVRGLEGNEVLTTFAGLIDTRQKAQIEVLLKAPDPACDADGDGTPTCAVPGCCDQPDLAAQDCNDSADKGATASPFNSEDPCTQCGNGVDEDCDGQDAVCLDSDTDGVPDCQELACPAGAEKDPTIHPGAVELCDGKDNDCDNQIDEDLPFTDIDGQGKAAKKGDTCGIGECAGGVVECAPLTDAKSDHLVCSTAGKKATQENCDNQLDDDCDGKINNGCALKDIDGDGVENDKEDAACQFEFARFHAEFHPGAAEACCVAGKAAELCDLNCDGKTTPCDATDKDGDGSPAALDCDDADPLTYPDAPEKCGDGKVQACFGSDPACDTAKDKDGDGWYAPADCNDGDPKIHPQAKELCNGLDDDCDGIVDDGAPEALDAECGDPDGECGKQKGTLVCKHYPAEQTPGELDCASAFDAKSGTCVGCEGDNRPSTDLCDYLDNDCDGQSDEAYQYTQQDGKKLQVAGSCTADGACTPTVSCDGVGACGVGKVECNAQLDQAVCSTDPNGSAKQNKAEVCNDQDDDCNGQTDENLTAISDSTCQKIGVCSGAATKEIKTVCVAGKWLCDYKGVFAFEYAAGEACSAGSANCHCENLTQQCFKMVEATCDGLDNDCDGKTDDDFEFDDLGEKKLVTAGCGTGDCTGGTVVCAPDKQGLTCSSLGKITKEVCDAKDNDCDGQTDDGMTVADSSCKLVGVCSTDNVKASCPAGKWVCDYSGVPTYENDKEITCDAKDNDCDGKSDEDFDFDDLGVKKTIAQACGTGACAAGSVVCTADAKGVTCSTLPKKASEQCNGVDDDCDAQTDEDFTYKQQDGKTIAILAVCDGIGACGAGAVECASTSLATCSTDPNGSKHQDITEKCDDLDNDCDGQTDEKCDDDKDGYCDKALETVNKPKVCPSGGNDCQKDNPAINPGVSEICDGIDNNCSGTTDEIFFYKEKGKDLGVNAACGLGVCSGGTVVCTGNKLGATCSTLGKLATDICNGLDDNCDGTVDEGCDDDKDGYCDAAIDWTSGASATCPNTKALDQRDCADTVAAVNPGATEKCNDVDDNCKAGTDEGCDDDNDDFCDASIEMGAKSAACPKGGNDCNDANNLVNPGMTEKCNDVDDNCAGGTDEGCDDDNDDYCDSGMTVEGTPKACPKSKAGPGDDCNDFNLQINPGITEQCNNIDDNCSGAADEGCDDDKDGWCDSGMVVVGQPKICAAGNGDCNDNNNAINPGVAEKCNGFDDNCKASTDEGCDDDGDGYCDASMVVVGTPGVCPKSPANTADDCNDAVKAVNPGVTEICNDVDDNCKGGLDEGCDDDLDGYCDVAMVVKGVPKICTKSKTDTGDDCNDKSAAINPGKSEVCDAFNTDENCDGQANGVGSFGCTAFYKDGDGDTFGTGVSVCLCEADSGNKLTAIKAGDCNDANATINPGVPADLCSTAGVDDNCDGKIDPENASGCKQFFLDKDGDSYGTGSAKCLCVADSAADYDATQGGDCLDSNAAVHPGVSKDTCSTAGVDDNCDGKTDLEGSGNCTDFYLDGDADTWGVGSAKCLCAADTGAKLTATKVTDCNDGNAAVNPGVAKDTCATAGVDDNCDGTTDAENSTSCTNFWEDKDADTYGKGSAKCLCAADVAKFFTATKGAGADEDCNDDVKAVNPGAKETCNTVDDNCNKLVDDGMSLADSTCKKAGVCTATIATCTAGTWQCVYPLTYEADTEVTCDAKDNDCDGQTDESLGLAQSTCKQVGVCSSGVAATCSSGTWQCNYSGVTGYEASIEASCDSKDNDCDGSTDEDFLHTGPGTDNTPKKIGESCGVGECAGGVVQCKPNKSGVECSKKPGETEICPVNSKDDDCDGATDEGC